VPSEVTPAVKLFAEVPSPSNIVTTPLPDGVVALTEDGEETIAVENSVGVGEDKVELSAV
jgi:hypothetical protein